MSVVIPHAQGDSWLVALWVHISYFHLHYVLNADTLFKPISNGYDKMIKGKTTVNTCRRLVL